VATGGSSCPPPAVIGGVALPLRGSIDSLIKVAAGGTVVFTISCVPPSNYNTDVEIAASIRPPSGVSSCGIAGCNVTAKVSKNGLWF